MRRFYFLLLALVCSAVTFAQSFTLVKDLHDKDVNTVPKSFAATSSMLFFYGAGLNSWTSNFTYYDSEVWVTDGTSDNFRLIEMDTTTQIVKSTAYGTYISHSSASVSDVFVFNDKVYFSANSIDGTQTNVYSLAGVDADTLRVRDGKWTLLNVSDDLIFYTDSSNGPIKSWDGINDPVLLGNQLFNNGSYDTVMVKPYSSLMPVGDKYVFDATYTYEPDEENPVKRQLFVLDPAGTEGPQVLKILRSGANTTVRQMAKYNDVVYFIATNDLGDYCIWTTDGTTGGTMEIAKIRTALGTTGNTGSEIFYYNGKIYFEGDDDTNEDQLYSYDIENDEVTRLTTLVKADGSGTATNLDPSNFVLLDGTLYFLGKYSYLKEDATSTSTATVMYKLNGNGEPEIIEESKVMSSMTYLTIFKNKIYFQGSISDYYDNGDETYSGTGTELFVFDPKGSTTAITPVAKKKQFSVSPNPSYGFVNVAGIESNEAYYELYNLTGSLAEKGIITNGVVDYSVHPGVYVLRIKDGKTSSSVKIVVK